LFEQIPGYTIIMSLTPTACRAASERTLTARFAV
jgi:hypothetical protein